MADKLCDGLCHIEGRNSLDMLGYGFRARPSCLPVSPSQGNKQYSSRLYFTTVCALYVGYHEVCTCHTAVHAH